MRAPLSGRAGRPKFALPSRTALDTVFRCLPVPNHLSRFRLCLLGRLGIEGDSPELATLLGRRRLVALLAVVGASGTRGVSRDTLLLYFWPESTASKARNSLNQALHAIRRDLGRDAILGTHDLRLNHDIITCDYAEFISAAETEQFERAISLHRGRLLEGFSLGNAPEWESWLAQERARETRVFCHAVEQMARAAEKAGDLTLAAKWWCQLAEVEPLSSRAVTHAVRALAASGDRSGAISRGERYVRDVREEIDADPDRSVTELVNEIRRLTPRSSPVLAGPEPESSDSGEVPVFETAARSIGDRAVAGNPPSRKQRYVALAALASALLIVSAIGWSWRTSGLADDSSLAPLVVVQTVSTPGAVSADGMALAGLMAAAIDGVLGVRAVVAGRDDATEGNGTGRLYRVVTELVRQTIGPIRGSAVLLDSRTGRPIAWATSTDESGNVFGLMDDLTRQVLLNVAARELGLQSSAVVTPDLRALQAYLDGEGRLRSGQNAAALESFTRAITLDTGFAYAHYRLGVTAELLGRDRLARAAFDAASRSSASLPPFERTMIDAAREMRSGRPFEAEQLYREAVTEYPANLEAWRELAWSTFYNSPLRGRPVTDASPALRRVLELNADDLEALIYTARIASLEGRASEAARLSRRLSAKKSGMTFENRAFRFLALADPAGVKRVTQALLSTPSRVLDSMALQSVVRVSPAAVERLARTLAAPEPPRDAQGFGYRLLAQSLVARGRPREALIALDSAVAFDSAMALEVRALYVATPEFGYDASAVAATRAALSRWNSSGETLATVHSEAHLGLHGALREYLLGRLALRSSDVRAAERHAQALSTIRADATLAARISTLEHSLRAHIEFARRNWPGAISELDRAQWPGSASALIAEAGDRFLRAMALEQLGRTEDARSWYASLAQRTSYELVYLGLAEYRLGLMAEAMRDRRSAAAHFARVQDLYSRGDTAALRLATEAARRLR